MGGWWGGGVVKPIFNNIFIHLGQSINQKSKSTKRLKAFQKTTTKCNTFMKFYYNTIKIKHSSFRTVAPQQETMYIYLSAKKKAIGFNTYKFISPMAPLRRSRGQTNTQSRQPQTSVASTKVSHQYLVYHVLGTSNFSD